MMMSNATLNSMFKVDVEDNQFVIKVHWPTVDDYFGFEDQEYREEWFVFRKFLDSDMDTADIAYSGYIAERLIDEFYDDVDAFVDEVDGTFIYDQLTSERCFSFVYDEKISLRVRIKARAMIIEREREVLGKGKAKAKANAVPMPSKWLMNVARGQMQALS